MIVLVNPNSYIPTDLAAIETPVWIAMYAALLERQGEEVRIIDANADDLSVKRVIEQIQSLSPSEVVVVAMGANPSASSTPKMPEAIKIREALTEDNIKGFIMGLHPRAMRDHAPTNLTALTHLRGITLSAWHLLPMDKYRAHTWHCLDRLDDRGNYASIYTSFGCPFNCYYCNIHVLYGGRFIRYRDPAEVVNEIGVLVETYGVKNLKLCDELFAMREDRVMEICRLLKERRYNLNIWAYARVDRVNYHMLKAMKEAGINWVCFGFESANEDTRNSVHKTYDLKVMENAINQTRAAGINILGNFMFGLPHDNLDTMQETLDWAKNKLFDYVNFYIAMPYPGSQWFKDITEPCLEWDRYSQFSPNPVAPNYIVRFRDRAFTEYFSNPAYQDMIQKKFGENAKEHILELLEWNVR